MDDAAPRSESGPRITPGDRREIGFLADRITNVLGLATGSTPPNLFTTLAKHRKLFRPWLRFAGALMPGGTLARRETELVIIRVAARMGCTYEAEHHDRLARDAGITADELDRARDLSQINETAWSAHEAALLRAVDEFGDAGIISRPTWDVLAARYREAQLIELCLLIGHYEMLAKTINTLGIEPDGPPTKAVPGWVRQGEKLLNRSNSGA